jgi:serine/threonine-protein kinase
MYDGLRFKVQSVTGAVTINNQNIVVGYVLPGSCVIVIGPPDKLAARKFITVDVSHPEVDL